MKKILLEKKTFLTFKKWVQNIQTAGYKETHTVVFIFFKIISELEKIKIKQDDVDLEKAQNSDAKCWLPFLSWPCNSGNSTTTTPAPATEAAPKRALKAAPEATPQAFKYFFKFLKYIL